MQLKKYALVSVKICPLTPVYPTRGTHGQPLNTLEWLLTFLVMTINNFDQFAEVVAKNRIR